MGINEDLVGLSSFQILVHELTHVKLQNEDGRAIFYHFQEMGGTVFGLFNILLEETLANEPVFGSLEAAYAHTVN